MELMITDVSGTERKIIVDKNILVCFSSYFQRLLCDGENESNQIFIHGVPDSHVTADIINQFHGKINKFNGYPEWQYQILAYKCRHFLRLENNDKSLLDLEVPIEGWEEWFGCIGVHIGFNSVCINSDFTNRIKQKLTMDYDLEKLPIELLKKMYQHSPKPFYVLWEYSNITTMDESGRRNNILSETLGSIESSTIMHYIDGISITPDGNKMVVIEKHMLRQEIDNELYQYPIHVYCLVTGKLVTKLIYTALCDKLKYMDFSADGKNIFLLFENDLAGPKNSQFVVIDLDNKKEIFWMICYKIFNVSYYSKHNSVAIVRKKYYDSEMEIFLLDTQKQCMVNSIECHDVGNHNLCFSPNGEILIYQSDDQIIFYKTSDWTVFKTIHKKYDDETIFFRTNYQIIFIRKKAGTMEIVGSMKENIITDVVTFWSKHTFDHWECQTIFNDKIDRICNGKNIVVNTGNELYWFNGEKIIKEINRPVVFKDIIYCRSNDQIRHKLESYLTKKRQKKSALRSVVNYVVNLFYPTMQFLS